MEELFIVATLAVIVPMYIDSMTRISMCIYEFGCDIKKYFLYKKVKLDFEFDTENNLLSIATPENLPKNMTIKYEIRGITLKEIMRFKDDEKGIFRLRTYKTTTTDDNINNWTYYMNNGSLYKFKSFSYVFV